LKREIGLGVRSIDTFDANATPRYGYDQQPEAHLLRLIGACSAMPYELHLREVAENVQNKDGDTLTWHNNP
jgi:hypothetical protein